MGGKIFSYFRETSTMGLQVLSAFCQEIQEKKCFKQRCRSTYKKIMQTCSQRIKERVMTLQQRTLHCLCTGVAVMVYLRTPRVQSPWGIITPGKDSLGNGYPPVKIPSDKNNPPQKK